MLLSSPQAVRLSPSSRPSEQGRLPAETQDLQSSQQPHPSSVYSKSDVAELAVVEILGMTRAQLKQVIRSVQTGPAQPACQLPGPFNGQKLEDRLDFLDRGTLERLVYLARRTCRTQGY